MAVWLLFSLFLWHSYRETHLLANLLAVPPSAWADGKLAELAEQLGKMVEDPKSKSDLIVFQLSP